MDFNNLMEKSRVGRLRRGAPDIILLTAAFWGGRGVFGLGIMRGALRAAHVAAGSAIMASSTVHSFLF